MRSCWQRREKLETACTGWNSTMWPSSEYYRKIGQRFGKIRRWWGRRYRKLPRKRRILPSFDLSFRKWLSALDPEQTVEERNHLQSQWLTYVWKTAAALGEELVENAGTAALSAEWWQKKSKEKKWQTITVHLRWYNKFSYYLTESLK